jgi:serine/threonine protein phosphatase 1
MSTYVIGDLHGQFQSLKQCLVKCNFDYNQDTLIQLGDVVDGGEEAFECVEELLKIKKLIAIKGNHDDWS